VLLACGVPSCCFVAIDKVGAPVAASINNLNPFISTGLAILLLGEQTTLPILVGTTVIVLGTVLLSLSGKSLVLPLSSLAWYSSPPKQTSPEGIASRHTGGHCQM
jgi:drug/metabolite transporter (DMT)-like permease